MKRILTAAVSVPVALAGVFLLPDRWFFSVLVMVALAGTIEFIRIVGSGDPGRTSLALLLTVPTLAAVMTPGMFPQLGSLAPEAVVLVLAVVFVLGFGSIVVVSNTPVAQGLVALGALAFGTLYLAAPVASLFRLRQLDGPWLLVLCFAIVWLGDTFAYYCGRRWGRNKLAPEISPNKTKEGSIASLIAALVAAAIWSWAITGRVSVKILVFALVVGAAAQMGDLVESLLKRGAGVKDSGTLFPGHGGVLDRLDALFFAAPAAWLFLWLFGESGIVS